MNVLVIGSGGREHAFALKFSQSSRCDQLFVAPGNAGTQKIARNVAIPPDDFDAIGQMVKNENISLVVVGPEAPLVAGIKDFFTRDPSFGSVMVIAPSGLGSMLEGSKDFAKQFMEKYDIPTGKAVTFDGDHVNEGIRHLESLTPPIVLKADGLAAGKGVIINRSVEEAKATFNDMLVDRKFGEASAKVLIEEYLEGIEVSVFVLTDGHNYLILPEAKDYKPIGEGDTGPNTGGMGAVSPVPFADSEFMGKVEERIIKPTIKGIHQEKFDYTGFLFLGLMSVQGDPYVIEYNVRMGDPETQAVFPRIGNDFVDLMVSTANRELGSVELDIKDKYAATVIMASEGYPGTYEKGRTITGIDTVSEATVFHAGTKCLDSGELVTHGGRVLAVTGEGTDIQSALDAAYRNIGQIHWEGAYFRKDIGNDLL